MACHDRSGARLSYKTRPCSVSVFGWVLLDSNWSHLLFRQCICAYPLHAQLHTCMHTHTHIHECTPLPPATPQAFINTAREIYRKIQDGVLDVSNEVRGRDVCVW